MERTTDRKNPIKSVVWKFKCYQCECDFTTYSWDYGDPPCEYCCSQECYEEYESIENKRDRIINNLLKNDE